MENTKTNLNQTLNHILMDILKTVYSDVGPQDMSASLDVVLVFDDQQRVSVLNNLKVNDLPKFPSGGTITKVNEVSKRLLDLPEMYRLKSCTMSVQPGGKVSINPVYMTN